VHYLLLTLLQVGFTKVALASSNFSSKHGNPIQANNFTDEIASMDENSISQWREKLF